MKQSSQILRVDPTTVIIFAVIFSPVLIGGTITSWQGDKTWNGVVICIGYFVALYWVCSPTVELLPGKLIYRALFKRKDIVLATISRVAVSARPAPTLELHRKGGERPLAFIIKPFAKQGVVDILRHIRQSNPAIRFDKLSEDMSKADFGSVTRKTVATKNLLRLAFIIVTIGVGGALIKLLLHG